MRTRFSGRVRLKTLALFLVAMPMLGGCSRVMDFVSNDPTETEYKEATRLPPLEIPPDLTHERSDDALLIPGVDQTSDVSSGAPKRATGFDPAPVASVADGATGNIRLERFSNNAMRILMQDDFPRAWREVGQALNGADIEVADRDRSRGIYFVDYPGVAPKQGWLSKLKFWGDDDPAVQRLLVVVQDEDAGGSQVLIFNEAEELEASPAAEDILGKIHQQLQ